MGHVGAAAFEAGTLEGRVAFTFQHGRVAVLEDERPDVHGRITDGSVVVGDANRDPLLRTDDQLRGDDLGLQPACPRACGGTRIGRRSSSAGGEQQRPRKQERGFHCAALTRST
jgi:hypothetical protein